MKSWRWTSGVLILLAAQDVQAQDGAHHEVYGFVKMDAGIMTRAVDPAWFDVMLPSRLPARADQFGKGDAFYASVRATRLGVRSSVPVAGHPLSTTLEFDMFGVGPDAGRTTFHPRVFYGEWNRIGAGQQTSVFIDLDAYPAVLDHTGPTGFLLARNPQIRWVALDRSDAKLMVGLERPSWTNDFGVLSGTAEAATVASRFSMPDITGSGRIIRDWGYVHLGGVVRRIVWDDLASDSLQLDNEATGWGVLASTSFKAGARDVLKIQASYGKGIQNYFIDAQADVATEMTRDPVRPVRAEPLTTVAVTAFAEHKWNGRLSSTAGYSQINKDTTTGQRPDAYCLGQYALANVIYRPADPLQMGLEVGWWRRANNSDGYSAAALRVAASFKYLFSVSLGP